MGQPLVREALVEFLKEFQIYLEDFSEVRGGCTNTVLIDSFSG